MTHRVPPRGESEQSVPRHQSAVTLATAARLTTAFVVLGVALRVWNFVAVSSLWLDEILLSRNILGRGLWQLLTEPLQLDQVVSVELYDLSDPERLRAASADSFEVAPMPSARPGCRPWIRPSPLDRL